MGKLEAIREKGRSWKANLAAKKEKFRQEHPKAADNILKAKVIGGLIVIWGIPIIGAYSMGRDDEKTKNQKDDIQRGLDRIKEGPCDYIDKEGHFNQDIGYDWYAQWSSKEAYLEAETRRVNECVPTLDL